MMLCSLCVGLSLLASRSSPAVSAMSAGRFGCGCFQPMGRENIRCEDLAILGFLGAFLNDN